MRPHRLARDLFHGCWAASISMPPLTCLSGGVRTEEERLRHKTSPPPVTINHFISRLPFSSHLRKSALSVYHESAGIPSERPSVECEEGGVRGLFVSHKMEMWREEWRVNERIRKGGQAVVTVRVEKGGRTLAFLDCQSWSAALVLRRQRGQRSLLNDELRCWRKADPQGLAGSLHTVQHLDVP